MKDVKQDQIRSQVRENYAKVALKVNDESTCHAPGCCTPQDQKTLSVDDISKQMGYSAAELQSIPNGANMGLGCGNPQAIADLKEGDVVLDLGSGGGFDCFLAAPKVGSTGKVIGVDMTPEMITKSRNNASKSKFENVEFRLGEIEHLPVSDESTDVIMSNCVINLSPDKQSVFNEAYRVLKGGGRLAISDIVLTADLPDEVRNNIPLYSGCVTGASSIHELNQYLSIAGFTNISIEPKKESKAFIKDWAPEYKVEDFIVSAVIKAEK
ncbi:Methyltransferase domain-containing protein [Amphibacillus marinus]|uniref:Arsenite methyltransferase n=1 Tax=Amphibacillus marinus TaxID=872970 RepID=A0A1H8TGZ5_9BACI|nr:arsenite methyltransferase [Amphibacillus marinus]SEO90192.1 Methyltransferase domain-containing protein [Amphibacillus marinus]